MHFIHNLIFSKSSKKPNTYTMMSLYVLSSRVCNYMYGMIMMRLSLGKHLVSTVSNNKFMPLCYCYFFVDTAKIVCLRIGLSGYLGNVDKPFNLPSFPFFMVPCVFLFLLGSSLVQ